MMNRLIKMLVIQGLVVLLMIGCGKEQGNRENLFTDNDEPRSRILMDFNWKFHRGDNPEAYQAQFKDAEWRSVDLPHDWSIEDVPGTESPLDPEAPGGIDMGYFQGGTAWYRKTFKLPYRLRQKHFYLLFEGVYMDSEVWVNGERIGNHPYGYTSFWFDITDHLKFGRKNNIAVKVKNEGKNSRWYSGSGIYRHVWLTMTEPVHVSPWGIGINTPFHSKDHATVLVRSNLNNKSRKNTNILVNSTILNQDGQVVSSTQKKVEAVQDGKVEVDQELEIVNPDLWSPDSPVLYTLVTEIEDDRSGLLDRVETPFGIRYIEFTTEGFFLNGKNMLLRGGCVHHDKGILGAASYDRAEERYVELMKASGFNSIRCAHNPPSPAFLDACDRQGILVINEAFDMWRRPKNPQDYHRFFDEWWKSDVESMVLRDRNHPSVIMWSTGNEIPERADKEGVETSQRLAGYIRQLDPTRPVTSAVNGLNPDKDPYFATLDIAGYNYAFGGDHGRESIFETDHRRVPERIMYCSESYPLTAFGAWMDVVDHPYVIGDFVWTGFDYLGEASIGWLGYPHEGSFYPWNHAYCGDIDVCGQKRPQSYYRNVLWQKGQQLSIFVQPPSPSFTENPNRRDWSKWHWQDVVDNWNWEGSEGEPMNVEVYSGYDRVELFLNGKSLGSRNTGRENEWIARWKVPYAPGTLKAVAYCGNEKAAEASLVTAGKSQKIRLTPDRSELLADGQDLSYILVELLDGNGNLNKVSDERVDFRIEGPGTILAVGSSNPMSTESYQKPYRNAYRGKCMVVIKSGRNPGEIKLSASSGELNPGEVLLTSK